MFVATIALSMSVDIVIFSPARRASRKLLETIMQFVDVAGCTDRVVEYNAEALRLRTYDEGNQKTSLIRSFPSRVAVISILT